MSFNKITLRLLYCTVSLPKSSVKLYLGVQDGDNITVTVAPFVVPFGQSTVSTEDWELGALAFLSRRHFVLRVVAGFST